MTDTLTTFAGGVTETVKNIITNAMDEIVRSGAKFYGTGILCDSNNVGKCKHDSQRTAFTA